ncbi:Putative odorant receptor 13a [Melipona quadrifasciata]|uniref:Putative odorant receptor 13a n=1 Tax=Melipona quadrifasciata TaxID=166423 RepID=A0A0N0U7H0_9HYME|nr:Putative odorant receptor 13a [Melipona quadrifasciata]
MSNDDIREKEILDNCKMIFSSCVTTIGICAMVAYLTAPFTDQRLVVYNTSSQSIVYVYESNIRTYQLVVSQCDMSSVKTDDISISLTSIFMKLVGLWMASNRSEQRVRDITVSYTLIAIVFAIWIQSTDMYYSWGDLSACLFTACNMLSLMMPFIKIIVLLAHKEDFFRLILYLQRKFLHADYNNYERQIVIGFKRKCTFFIYFFTFFTLATVVSYIVNPLIANIGRNESDRVLPFNMWVDLPLTTTPYYEITFVLQVLSFHDFITTEPPTSEELKKDKKIANMPDLMDKEKQRRNEASCKESTCFTDECYTIFKKYIRQHQALIGYCEKLEEVFNWIILEQVLMFNVPTRTRLIFSFHIGACLCQLLMFTYSCDCIIRESMSVSTAAYRAPWPLVSMTASGRMMQKDLTLVIMRSSVPCCLTGKGFFIVSLETSDVLHLYLRHIVFTLHKEDFFRLILYLQERFLCADYNDYEERIIIGCKRKCIFFVSFLTFSIVATLGAYVLKPIIANISRNVSDRILPFNMWVDCNTILRNNVCSTGFVLISYLIGITYFCFDNFLCVLTLHVAAQFRVLQYRISNITDLMNRETLEKNQKFSANSSCFANKYYETFKKCIQQHQALIAYCKKLEKVFNLIVLVQILVFSIMICLHGYQLLIVSIIFTMMANYRLI